MSVFIHFKMKFEQGRYKEGQKVSYSKKHEGDKVKPEFVEKVLNLNKNAGANKSYQKNAGSDKKKKTQKNKQNHI